MFVRYNQQIFTRLKYIVLLINVYHTNIIKNLLFIVYFVGNSIFKIFTFLYNWLRMKISTVLFLRRLFIFYIRNSILIYLYIQICICEWHDFLTTSHFLNCLNCYFCLVYIQVSTHDLIHVPFIKYKEEKWR